MPKPHVSLPNLMKEIEGYKALSNLKINYTKSEAMGVALPLSVRRTIQFNFKWALKYLCTYISSNLGYTFVATFPSLYDSVRSLLGKWHQVLHSWFG